MQMNNKLRVPENLRKVKNIVGIFSAKGGVGKSAISLQIATALKEKRFKGRSCRYRHIWTISISYVEYKTCRIKKHQR